DDRLQPRQQQEARLRQSRPRSPRCRGERLERVAPRLVVRRHRPQERLHPELFHPRALPAADPPGSATAKPIDMAEDLIEALLEAAEAEPTRAMLAGESSGAAERDTHVAASSQLAAAFHRGSTSQAELSGRLASVNP